MKFLRLDLLAYGPFTNRSLVLPAEGPNFHIVYGSNEAGKSTTLRAISGLLFGIEKNTGDAHQHAMSDLRIGARLRHSSGAERSYVRRKGNAGTLLDEHGAAIDEEELRAWLSVTDRKHFEQMFGLSHEQLRAAGEALADAKTAAGEALFGAALDGISLRRTLSHLDAEADRLFSPRSSTAAVNKALATFREQMNHAKKAVVPPREWSATLQEKEAADARLAECGKQLIELQAKHHRLVRLQKALPWLRRHAEAVRDRAAMGDVQLLPLDTPVRRRELEQGHQAAEERLAALHAKLRDRESERAALEVPDEFLAARSDIQPLIEELGRYRSDTGDRPGAVKTAAAHKNNELAILRDLGCSDLDLKDIEQLRPGESFRKHVRTLDKEGITLADRRAQQRGHLAELRAAVAQRSEALASLPAPGDVEVLRLTWQRLQVDQSLDAQVRAAEARVAQDEMRATAALRTLSPWSSTLETAAGWSPPSADAIQHAAKDLQEIEQGLERLGLERRSALDAFSEAERHLAALAADSPVPTEERLAESRARRDEGLRRLLSAWTRGEQATVVDADYAAGQTLAEALAAAVQAADRAADALRSQVDRVVAFSLWQRKLKEHETRLATLEAEIATQSRRRDEWQASWRRLWAEFGFEPGTPREMREWCGRHAALVVIVREWRESTLQCDQLQERWSDCRAALEAGLAAASASLPPGTPWPTLLAHVTNTLRVSEERAARADALRKQVAEQLVEQARLEAQLSETEQALEAWQIQWRTAMTKLRLGPEVRGNEVDVVLDRLDDLFRYEELRQREEARLRAINKRAAAFETVVTDLAAKFTPSRTGPVDEIADGLIALHRSGTKAAERRASLDEQIRHLQSDINEAQMRHESTGRRLADLLQETGCASLEALRLAEERSVAARRLDEQREQAEQRLDEIREDWSLEALTTAAAGASADVLAAEIESCAAEIKRFSAEQQDAIKAAGALDERAKKFSGGADAAASLAEAHEHLASARSHAERYAKFRIATTLLQRAVENYRQKHQGAILRRASVLFQRLTLGRYQDLRLVYLDDSARLRCSRDEKLVEVERALSDGTLDQLFLSLRLASLEQHLESQEPMPMVLDDIFIHFDDDRTHAGLTVLAEFATKTQVLLLTHHARNLDLARRTLAPGQWSEHVLGAAGAPPAS